MTDRRITEAKIDVIALPIRVLVWYVLCSFVDIGLIFLRASEVRQGPLGLNR